MSWTPRPGCRSRAGRFIGHRPIGRALQRVAGVLRESSSAAVVAVFIACRCRIARRADLAEMRVVALPGRWMTRWRCLSALSLVLARVSAARRAAAAGHPAASSMVRSLVREKLEAREHGSCRRGAPDTMTLAARDAVFISRSSVGRFAANQIGAASPIARETPDRQAGRPARRRNYVLTRDPAPSGIDPSDSIRRCSAHAVTMRSMIAAGSLAFKATPCPGRPGARRRPGRTG